MNRIMIAISMSLLGWLMLPSLAFGHSPSSSHLRLTLDDSGISGRWDIALRDLEHAIGLDNDGDGAITWAELKARHADIAAYALARLRLADASRQCALRADNDQQVVNHADGAYTALFFHADCANASALKLRYSLLFDLDPTHRGLLTLVYPDAAQSAVLSPEQSELTLQARSAHSGWRTFTDYWREGVWHIWIGFDHLLFLLTLLLPAVLWRKRQGWQPAASLRSVVIDTAGIVSAFTVAHSLTLCAAALGWTALPARWVESAIAASVILAAVNNLYPLCQRRWLIGFTLGLLHGFGFANVLLDLSLPPATLAAALAGFNLGVESGQLAIVILLLPLAYALRETWFYRRVVLQLGSATAAAAATLWLAQRVSA